MISSQSDLWEKDSQQFLLLVWIVLSLVGGELELTVALFQLLEVGVHLGGEVEEDQGKRGQTLPKIIIIIMEEKKKAHLAQTRVNVSALLLQIQGWTVTEEVDTIK